MNKKAGLFLAGSLSCAAVVGVLWTLGWLRIGGPVGQEGKTPLANEKKHQQLILGKWEGNRKGLLDGLEFTNDGYAISLTLTEGQDGLRLTRMAATYKLLDGNSLEITSTVMGEEKTLKGQLDTANDQIQVTDEDRQQVVIYHRVKDFSPSLSKSKTQKAVGTTDNSSKASSTAKATLTFKGHKASVESVAFSPDGALVASGGDDGVVILWERATGAVKHALDPKDAGKGVVGEKTVTSVAFSPDGTTVASASGVGVKFWNVQTGELRKSPPLSGKRIAFSPDGTRLLVCGYSKIHVWDLVQDKEVVSTKLELRNIQGTAVSSDGKWIATGDLDAYAKVWDATTGEQRFSYKSSSGQVFSVAFSPDSRLLAADLGSIRVKLFDVAKEEEIPLKGGMATRSLSQPYFMPDGRHLACVDVFKDEIVVCEYESGQQRLILKGHTGRVKALATSPDGKWIVSASQDHRVNVWDVSSVAGPPLKLDLPKPQGNVFRKRDSVKELYQLEIGQSSTDCLVFSADGKRLASSGGNFDKRLLVVWDFPAKKQVEQKDLGRWPNGRSVAFTADANSLAFTSEEKLQKGVRIWNLAAKGKEGDGSNSRFLVLSPELSADCCCVATSHDGKLLAAGGRVSYSEEVPLAKPFDDKDKKDSPRPSEVKQTGRIVVWDTTRGEQKLVLQKGGLANPVGTDGVSRLAFSPNDRWLVGVHHDRQITFWSVADGKEEKTLELSLNIRSMAFDPKGRFLAVTTAGGKGSALSLWDLREWKERTLTQSAAEDGVTDAAFSPDGQYLVAVGARGSVWETSTGRLLKEFDTGSAQKGVPRRIAFHPGGEQFAMSGPYRTTSDFGPLVYMLQVWRLDLEALGMLKH